MVKPYRRQKFKAVKPRVDPVAKNRASRHERGYDNDWVCARDKSMAAYGGLCQECRRRGYVETANAVDHIIPLLDAPHLRLSQANLEPLCNVHHNGFKRRIEAHARAHGLVMMLQRWIKHPETRPPQFQIVRYGPMKEPTDGDLSGQGSQSEPDIPAA